jgi:hypothetical protein
MNPEARMALRLVKRSGRLVRVEGDKGWLKGRAGFSTAWRRIGVFVDLVSDPRTPDGAWEADLGDWAARPGTILAFCSNHESTILVPDRGFFFSDGYRGDREAGSMAPPFMERDAAIVWRGAPSGQGEPFADRLDAADPRLRQRVRMCLMLANHAEAAERKVDVGIARSRGLDPGLAARYEQAGLLRDPVSERSWCGRRYAIDIDGHANAFSNLFRRLLYGCCVIKVASPLGFRQWYYDRLVPWTHYVPVQADLTDLRDAIEWVHDRPSDAERIAAEGRRLAASMDLEAERARVIARLQEVGSAGGAGG